MVKVCDAIMGTGKSSAAITYMNSHPEKRFIYITPYLGEVTRICHECSSMMFYEPLKVGQFRWSKTLHTAELVRKGCNVATTHQAFRYYSNELLEAVRARNYTLIIDEDVNVLETVDEEPGIIKMVMDAGYIKQSGNDIYHLVKDDYKGETFKDLFQTLRQRDIIRVGSRQKDCLYYWLLPPELITSFEDVFVLTYRFRGQSLYHFFEMYKIPYEYIGVERDENGAYHFGKVGGYIPTYVKTLKEKINIVDEYKLNAVGDKQYSLSKSWFARKGDGVERLRKNLYNYFHNINNDFSASDKMWGTFEGAKYSLRGKGYTNGFVAFNKRATNEYSNRRVLAYCINIYMNVGQKLFYQSNNIEVDDDEYALSTMVQWIWRSAIRNGEEIRLYVPSKRMRELLQNWIEEVSNYECV